MKKIKPRYVSLAMGIISVLLWWEMPAIILCLCLINGIVIFDNFDKSIMMKLCLVLCLLGAVMSIINLKFDLGMMMLEKYYNSLVAAN